MKLIDIVVPAFNEAENIPELVSRIRTVLAPLPYSYSVMIVDDGSTDNTLSLLRAMAANDPHLKYISLSKNFGHQNAIKAGLDHTKADCVITMDGDLQHPPELIPVLLKHWEEGYEVVYTIRKEDEGHLGYFKRKSSNVFYRIMNGLANIKIEKGSADFRLLSKRVVYILRGMEEHELFYRGLVKWIGFRQIGIDYHAEERKSGKSKYSLVKMIRFGLQGITSFSTKPLYIAAYLGLIFSLLSLLYIPYALLSYFFGHTVSGWVSIIVTISFFGGMQLSILGIIGLYLGKIFMQGKKRPQYIIKELKYVQREVHPVKF
jgi:glycosyltransferase involved in cell wall biosynthesis